MKLLLLGKDGQVGWELQRSLAPLGEVVALGRAEADLENAEKLQAVMEQHRPDVIVNAAAYTAVDQAESDTDKAWAINAKAVEIMAAYAKQNDAWLVHYSTDYVYDGSKTTPYTENDVTNPLSIYGASKLAGEQAAAQHAKHLVFRTSWVFATRGKNFVHTILKHARDKEQLKIVSDQFGAPTSAELIADVTAQALAKAINNPGLAGVYHLTAKGRTSWHGYAAYFLDLARQRGDVLCVAADQVLPVSSDEYPVKAKRPQNSCLNTEKLEKAFGLSMPNWQYHVHRMIQEVIS